MTKKILVADDDSAIADVVKMILEMQGYLVETSPDGQVLYELKSEYPDLILLDIWMSGYDGRQICTHLKQGEQTKKIPIILISASKDVALSAKEAGADDFITKPFEIEELLAKVKKYMA